MKSYKSLLQVLLLVLLTACSTTTPTPTSNPTAIPSLIPTELPVPTPSITIPSLIPATNTARPEWMDNPYCVGIDEHERLFIALRVGLHEIPPLADGLRVISCKLSGEWVYLTPKIGTYTSLTLLDSNSPQTPVEISIISSQYGHEILSDWLPLSQAVSTASYQKYDELRQLTTKIDAGEFNTINFGNSYFFYP